MICQVQVSALYFYYLAHILLMDIWCKLELIRVTCLAGLRETKDVIESKGIEKTKEKINKEKKLNSIFSKKQVAQLKKYVKDYNN